MSRGAKEAEDVGRAEARATELHEELAALESELQAGIDAITVKTAEDPIETIAIKPKRAGVDTRLVALVAAINFKFQVPGSKFQVPASEFRVRGPELRVPAAFPRESCARAAC